MGIFNKPKKDVPGKTYSFSKEEKDMLERNLTIVNFMQQVINGQEAVMTLIYRQAKQRVGLDPFRHVQPNLHDFTFFVPEIPTPQPGPEEEKK